MRVGQGEQHEPPLFLDKLPKRERANASHVLAEAHRAQSKQAQQSQEGQGHRE